MYTIQIFLFLSFFLFVCSLGKPDFSIFVRLFLLLARPFLQSNFHSFFNFSIEFASILFSLYLPRSHSFFLVHTLIHVFYLVTSTSGFSFRRSCLSCLAFFLSLAPSVFRSFSLSLSLSFFPSLVRHLYLSFPPSFGVTSFLSHARSPSLTFFRSLSLSHFPSLVRRLSLSLSLVRTSSRSFFLSFIHHLILSFS